MWAKLRESPWMLPAASAAFLVLAFHPFDLWWLAFVALSPLYYFVAAAPTRPRKEVFLGGFITGGVFALSLSYFTVVQFKWVPEAHLFTDLVHLSFLPIGILGGLLCGGFCTLAYRYLRTSSPALNMLAGAGAFTAGEMLLYALCGGYYFAMLGYAAANVPPLISFASIGGAFSVSFLVALINSAVAEGFALPASARRRFARDAALLAAAALLVYGGNQWYLSGAAKEGEVSVRVVQTSSRDAVGFGTMDGEAFSFPSLARRLQEAGEDAPDLLIYPFSPVEGALYVGEKPALNKPILVAPREAFLDWANGLLPASTTLMVWTTLYEDGGFHNVFEYIQEGRLVGEYRKRALFPFIDYTPLWAQRLGFFTTQIDQEAGEDRSLAVAGVPISGMLCSEIHKQDLAREDAPGVQLIVSAGSEAIFVDDVASEYSLKAAQFRAAETRRPAVRANLLGPSGIIGSDGAVLARLDRGVTGELGASVTVEAPRTTLYARFGHLPLLALLAAILGSVLLRAARRGTN